jgi:hypothetical protein
MRSAVESCQYRAVKMAANTGAAPPRGSIPEPKSSYLTFLPWNMPNIRRFVSEQASPDTAGHMALKPMRTSTSPGDSQSEMLF